MPCLKVGTLPLQQAKRSFLKTVRASTLMPSQGRMFCSPYPTQVRAYRPTPSNTSLNPSSRPRKSGKALAWPWPQFLGSSNNTRDSSSSNLSMAAERLSASINGRGTTFRVYLPVACVAVQTAPHPTQLILQRGTETILVAEDDEDVRQ